MPEQSSQTLVYIMGDGRSGSTILSVLLGAHPDIISVGELNRWPQFEGKPKWNNQKQQDHAFWQAVYDAYVAQTSPPHFEELITTQELFERYEQFPILLRGRLPKESVDVYSTYLSYLLKAIALVSDKRIILDASKNPGRAYSFWRHQSDRVTKIIHLVRDPRGVMWSHMKRDGEHKYKPLMLAVAHYMIKNFMCSLVDGITPQDVVLRVRYEDLIQHPTSELTRIGQFLGLTMDSVVEKVTQNHLFDVPPLLDGNQIRQKSSLRLAYDDEWHHKLSSTHRWRINVFTAPLMISYGYWRQCRR